MDIKNNLTEGQKITFFILKNIWFVIAITLISTIAMTIYTIKLPNWYVSTVNLVPPQNSSSIEGTISSLSSALKDFGVAKAGSNDGYDLLVILKSRTVIDSIISKYNLKNTYDLKNPSSSDVRNAFLENCQVTYEKEGNYTISIWDQDKNKASQMANDYANIANSLAAKVFKDEAINNLNYLEQRMTFTENALNKISIELQKYSSSKKLFSPLDQAKALSTSLSELKASEMKHEIAYNLFKNNYGANDPQTKMQEELVNETKRKLKEANEQSGFAGNFTLSEAPGVGLTYANLYTQFETFTKVRAFLMPSLEKAKLDLVKSSHILYVLDSAIPADKKDKPKRSVYVLGATVGSFAFSIFVLVIYQSFMIFLLNYKNYQKHLTEK